MDFPFYLRTESAGLSNVETHEVFYFLNVEITYNDRIKKYDTSACMNVGAAVGGAVGGLFLLCGGGAGLYLYFKKGKANKTTAPGKEQELAEESKPGSDAVKPGMMHPSADAQP